MAVIRMIKYDDLSILPVIFSGAELAGVRSDWLPPFLRKVLFYVKIRVKLPQVFTIQQEREYSRKIVNT